MDQLPVFGAAAERDAGDAIVDNATGAMSFSFGDAESVLDRRELFQYVEAWSNGRWYEPPLRFDDLNRTLDMAPHHASAIRLKVNLLAKHFIPSRWLSLADFRKWALDFLVMGNGFLEERRNLAGRPLVMNHALARFTRRGIEDGAYWWLPTYRDAVKIEGRCFQLIQEHTSQEIYGLPEYLSGIQAGLLNESATLFRRRYYKNGSHAGFILYMSGADFGQKETDAIRQAMKDAKGPGNFRNLFLHIPAGKPEGVKVIPVAEVAAKDIFADIKNTTRDDLLAVHRTPPQLLGVVPNNSGGFGDVAKASDVYFENEIEPLQGRFLELNDWIGAEAVAFRPYERQAVTGAAPR